MVATNIIWDLDEDDDVCLPDEILIPDHMTEEEAAEFISDVTGFCHKGYSLHI